MKIDVKCVCGRVHEVTPLIPKGDDGVYVPFGTLPRIRRLEDGNVDSTWRGWSGSYGCSDNYVTCKCGKEFSVVVEISLDGIPYQRFLIDNPGGKQVHATRQGDGKCSVDTYLYQEDGPFYFEKYSRWEHTILFLHRDELREHVAKLMPLLFTPEELKQMLAPR